MTHAWTTTDNTIDDIQLLLLYKALIKHYKKFNFKLFGFVDTAPHWYQGPHLIYYSAKATNKKNRWVPQYKTPVLDISRNIYLELRYDYETCDDKVFVDLALINRAFYCDVKDM